MESRKKSFFAASLSGLINLSGLPGIHILRSLYRTEAYTARTKISLSLDEIVLTPNQIKAFLKIYWENNLNEKKEDAEDKYYFLIGSDSVSNQYLGVRIQADKKLRILVPGTGTTWRPGAWHRHYLASGCTMRSAMVAR